VGALANDRLRQGPSEGDGIMSKVIQFPGTRKQTDPELLRRLLLGNIKCLLRHRYGPTLPDDDAGREDLLELLMQVSLRPKSAAKVMRNTIEVWAPWMPDAEAAALIQSVELTPPNLRYRTAKDLGRRFNVTNAERERLRLWLIAAVDVNPDEIRKAKRRERQRLYWQRVTRKAGVRSRMAYLAASVSKQKPWVAEGISRRTWYYRRARQIAQPVAQVPTDKLL
jgi:hypothetical protein